MQILIGQEMALHRYDVRQNPLELKRLLSAQFREVGESGCCYDYDSICELLRQEKPARGFVHSQEYECIDVDTNTRLLLYKSAHNDGLGNYSHFARRSSLWVCNQGQWQMQYHQGTGCPPFVIEE